MDGTELRGFVVKGKLYRTPYPISEWVEVGPNEKARGDDGFIYALFEGKPGVFPVSWPLEQSAAKSRPDLFPPKALLLAGDVLAFGDTKHPDEKWKTMSVEDHLGAAYRHVLRWQSGETLDSETSKSHLVHALVRLAMAGEQETAIATPE